MALADAGYSQLPEGLTAGTPAVSAIQSIAARLVLGRLARWKGSPLEMVLPDGTVKLLGSGDRPLRVRVSDWRFFQRVLAGNDIGVGESFMAGEWETDDLVEIVASHLRGASILHDESVRKRLTVLRNRVRRFLDANTLAGSRRNIRFHYDLGNDLFASFLDETLTYSSAVFEHPGQSLADAQRAKIDGACRALGLKPGDHLLEIGSGWGSLAIHAASAYGCRVTSITLSEEQRRLAEQRAREAGVAGQVTFRLCDYREIEGSFDHIVSIEMLEAVGAEFYGGFFARCDRLLKPGGRMFVQTIVVPDRRFEEYRHGFDWIRKYIYPGGCLASQAAVAGALAGHTSLRIEWMRDIGPHYARTLRLWRERFLEVRSHVRALGYDERFLRMWEFYLASCEAAFAVGHIGNLQMVIGRAHEAAPVEG